MTKVALYIGEVGAGLLPCVALAREFRATTVTIVSPDSDGAEAVALRRLIARLSHGEFEGLVAWLDQNAVPLFTRSPFWPAQSSRTI